MQIRCLSPKTSSIRPTVGHIFASGLTNDCSTTIQKPISLENVGEYFQLTAGYAACFLEYGRFHGPLMICSCVCGAIFNGFTVLLIRPSSISFTSIRIDIIASQNRSSSSLSSDSVGSIINVPATGHDLKNEKN